MLEHGEHFSILWKENCCPKLMHFKGHGESVYDRNVTNIYSNKCVHIVHTNMKSSQYNSFNTVYMKSVTHVLNQAHLLSTEIRVEFYIIEYLFIGIWTEVRKAPPTFSVQIIFIWTDRLILTFRVYCMSICKKSQFDIYVNLKT